MAYHHTLAGAFALTLLLSTRVYACGAWDIGCEVRETIQKPGDKVGQAGRNLERTWNQGRTDLSNGLNRIDPRITQIGRDIDASRLKFQSEVFSGPALEQWIIQSRNSAIGGAIPIPLWTRNALRGWYPESLMNLVRWKVGDGGALNVSNAAFSFGEANAITLIDLIIFRNAQVATQPALWAHEMKHIEQYKAWGVHSFAVQYARSWNSVEDPAYDVERRYAAQLTQQSYVQPQLTNRCAIGQGSGQQCQIPTLLPTQSGCICVTYDGRAYYGITY